MKHLLNVLSSITELASEEINPEIAQRLSSMMEAQSVILLRMDGRGAHPILESGIDPSGITTYTTYYHSKDIWLQTGLAMPPGRAISLDRLVDKNDFMSSEFYFDFLRHHGNFTHCMGSHFEAGSAHYSIAFQRSHGQHHFDDEDEQRFDRLIPHLQQILTMRETLMEARQRVALLQDVAMHDGERYVVDKTLRVIWMDEQPNRLLSINAGVLTLPQVGWDTVRKMVSDVIGGGISAASTFMYGKLVITLDPVNTASHPTPLALITVRDRMMLARGRARRAASLFGLTSSERVLCESLLLGRSPQKHAETHGVAISTVRSHIKMLMAKTGASRQAELVALVSELEPAQG